MNEEGLPLSAAAERVARQGHPMTPERMRRMVLTNQVLGRRDQAGAWRIDSASLEAWITRQAPGRLSGADALAAIPIGYEDLHALSSGWLLRRVEDGAALRLLAADAAQAEQEGDAIRAQTARELAAALPLTQVRWDPAEHRWRLSVAGITAESLDEAEPSRS